MEEDPEVGEALVEKRKGFSGKMLRWLQFIMHMYDTAKE